MSKLVDASQIFSSIEELKNEISPLEKKRYSLQQEFNTLCDTMSYDEHQFLREKLYATLTEEEKEKIEAVKARNKEDIRLNRLCCYVEEDPFDPLNDAFKIIAIDSKSEEGETFIRVQVSPNKSRGTISGILTFYNNPMVTDWFNIKELDNI